MSEAHALIEDTADSMLVSLDNPLPVEVTLGVREALVEDVPEVDTEGERDETEECDDFGEFVLLELDVVVLVDVIVLRPVALDDEDTLVLPESFGEKVPLFVDAAEDDSLAVALLDFEDDVEADDVLLLVDEGQNECVVVDVVVLVNVIVSRPAALDDEETLVLPESFSEKLPLFVDAAEDDSLAVALLDFEGEVEADDVLLVVNEGQNESVVVGVCVEVCVIV